MKAQDYFTAFLLLLLAKLGLVLALRYADANFFGGGNDSYFYDAYARGIVDTTVNSWNTLLRVLYQWSLYSRQGVSNALTLIAFLVLPLCIAALCKVKQSPLKVRAYWAAACIVAAYPTIIFYAMDIYRDVFMLIVWAVGLFVFKALAEEPRIGQRAALLLLGLAFAMALFTLRPYLGFAYLVALLFSGFYSFKKSSPLVSVLLVGLALFVFYILGLLEPILAYREIFDEMGGGSTLGLEFASAATFFPDLIKSTAAQLFGLHFSGMAAIAVFLLETIPFVLFLAYVVANRAHSNKFIDYLIVFFVVYSIVWLLGNDNLGTAVRLRTFNYLAIVVAFFVIYQNKSMALRSITPVRLKRRFRLWPVPAVALNTTH